MQKTNLLNQLSTYKPENENITLNVYSGYSFIHVDLLTEGHELIWTTISISDADEDKSLEIKICAINDSFKVSKENMKYFKELINILNTYEDIKSIYGRIRIPEKYKKFEALFTELGFTFAVSNDKSYPTAKIKYTK